MDRMASDVLISFLSASCQGKTIQVISFLSAIMRKTGTSKDEFRRRDHVAKLQDSEDWSKFRKLPPANDMWPTALIIAPSSVAMNWQRELETARSNFIWTQVSIRH